MDNTAVLYVATLYNGVVGVTETVPIRCCVLYGAKCKPQPAEVLYGFLCGLTRLVMSWPEENSALTLRSWHLRALIKRGRCRACSGVRGTIHQDSVQLNKVVYLETMFNQESICI